jgi:uncharacterized membrane protein
MDEEGTLKIAFRVDFPDGGSVDWGWTDWIGLVALLLGIAVLLTVIVALIRRESPLKILRQICMPLTYLVKRHSS